MNDHSVFFNKTQPMGVVEYQIERELGGEYE